MKRPHKRTAVLLSLGAVGLAGLIGTAFLLAPNEITEAPGGTCVARYMGDRYLMVDSCDSVFAHYAVITSTPVRESMSDSAGWEQRHCDDRVDGWSTYSIAEADGTDHIVCLGRANH